MKIKKEDYEVLKKYFKENLLIENVLKYKEFLKTHERYKNNEKALNERLSWDCFNKLQYFKEVKDVIRLCYSYGLNDNHLTTAFLKMGKELGYL